MHWSQYKAQINFPETQYWCARKASLIMLRRAESNTPMSLKWLRSGGGRSGRDFWRVRSSQKTASWVDSRTSVKRQRQNGHFNFCTRDWSRSRILRGVCGMRCYGHFRSDCDATPLSVVFDKAGIPMEAHWIIVYAAISIYGMVVEEIRKCEIFHVSKWAG